MAILQLITYQFNAISENSLKYSSMIGDFIMLLIDARCQFGLFDGLEQKSFAIGVILISIVSILLTLFIYFLIVKRFYLIICKIYQE